MAEEVEQGRDLDRVAAFSDGVFAIAITVLVLTLDFPKFHGEAPDRRVLDGLWRPVLTYFLSFYVIGVYWFAHHRMWHFIHRIDSRFIALNMVLLSFVAIMPFPTDLLGDYGDTEPGHGDLRGRGRRDRDRLGRGLVVRRDARTASCATCRRASGCTPSCVPLAAPVIFLASIPVAYLVDPDIAKACWLLVIPVRLLTMRNYGSVYEM